MYDALNIYYLSSLHHPSKSLIHLTSITLSNCRLGPGEQGTAVVLLPSDAKEKEALYRVNGFNGLASDKMSMNRAIKDIRHPE